LRRTPKDEVKARNIPTSSWGAHHGLQTDMLAGSNAYELPGEKYSKSAHAALPQAEYRIHGSALDGFNQVAGQKLRRLEETAVKASTR